MKKTAGWLVAAAALTIGMAACSSSEDAVEQPTPESPATQKTYTLNVTATKSPDGNALARAIVAAGDDGATRALSLSSDGKTLNATWDVGEKIRVLKLRQQSNDYTVIGTLSATTVSDDGLTATFTGPIIKNSISDAGGLEAGDKLVLGFPDTNLSDKPSSFVFNYTGQNGTLEKIATDYDFCMTTTLPSKMVTVSSVDESTGIVTTTGNAEFQNQQAIVRFTLYESDGTTAVLPKSLDITAIGLKQAVSLPENGTEIAPATPTVAETLTLTPDGSTNVIYAALRGISGQTVSLTATDADGNKYTYTTKTAVSFKNGQFYDIKVKMKAWTVKLGSVTAAGLTAQYGSATLTLEDGQTLTGTLEGSTEAGKVKIQIAAGATVTLHNAHINGHHYSDTDFPGAGINCLGDATIVLSGENSVTNFNRFYPAILAAHNASGDEYTLTIRGDGKLTAINDGYGAGIGGGDNIPCGNILIETGNITATGDKGSAGIGSGRDASCGNITISSGTITANGSSNGAAGIGSGAESSGSSSCGTITISGGNVIANGGGNGAGIGSGFRSEGSSSCGDITITGGTVTANGGGNAAGIGTGGNASCGDITINGGTVTATGGYGANSPFGGAGIGCGYGNDTKPSRCGNIWIGSDESKSFSVTAIKGKSAIRPIGHSSGESSSTSCGNIIFGIDENNKVYIAYKSPQDYNTNLPFVDVNFKATDGSEGEEINPLDCTTWKVWREKESY